MGIPQSLRVLQSGHVMVDCVITSMPPPATPNAEAQPPAEPKARPVGCSAELGLPISPTAQTPSDYPRSSYQYFRMNVSVALGWRNSATARRAMWAK